MNFEDGNGNTAYDLSPNGNNGIINGAIYDSNVPSQSCQLTTINGCDSVAVLNLLLISLTHQSQMLQHVKAILGMG